MPKVTAVGFEPTPLRTGALSQRLRPLGQTVMLTKHPSKGINLETEMTSRRAGCLSGGVEMPASFYDVWNDPRFGRKYRRK